MRLLLRILACAALGVAALSLGAMAAETRVETSTEAIGMLADLTLIDGECRDVEVNFGRAFQAAAERGVKAVDVMPTGALRAAFEAAARNRVAQTSHDELCDALVQGYAAQVSGVLRRR